MLDIEEITPTESTYRITGLTPEESVVTLEKRWEGTPYSMVAEECRRMLRWGTDRGGENRDTLLGWMIEHDTSRLVEESAHMVAAWDSQWEDADLDEEAAGMLTDCVEIVTVLIVAWNIDKGALEHDEGTEDDCSNITMEYEPIRLARAENMKRVREEHVKLANNRKRMTMRDPEDIPEIVTSTRSKKYTRTANSMRGKRLLRAAKVLTIRPCKIHKPTVFKLN